MPGARARLELLSRRVGAPRRPRTPDEVMSEPERGCTQLGRQACTDASRTHTAVVPGHAALCTILRNTADSVAMLRVAVEAVSSE